MGLFNVDETGTIEGCIDSAKDNIRIFEQYGDTPWTLGFAILALQKAEKLYYAKEDK